MYGLLSFISIVLVEHNWPSLVIFKPSGLGQWILGILVLTIIRQNDLHVKVACIRVLAHLCPHTVAKEN